jgi:hypothetical protein
LQEYKETVSLLTLLEDEVSFFGGAIKHLLDDIFELNFVKCEEHLMVV